VGFDLAGIDAEAFGLCFEGCSGGFVLLVILVEDGIHILARAIVAVAAVGVPKMLKQVVVADDFGVVINRDGLGVVSHGVVGGFLLGAASIADAGA